MHAAICDFLLDVIGNSIEAGSKTISIEVYESRKLIRCSVDDDGRGMSEQELRRVRDPFYTDGIKHRKRKVGLGIPFLQQAVSMTDGIFEITSEEGIGTKVVFSFPSGHIDTPPLGEVGMTFMAALTYPGSFEMLLRHSIEDEDGQKKTYSLQRSELEEILGELSDGQSQVLLRRFVISQEESLHE